MKRLLTLMVVTFFGFQSLAQDPENKGQWAVFTNHNYTLTLSDVVEIAKGMPNMHTGLYRLKNGEKFYVYCPERWVEIMKRILSKIKGSPVTSVADELAEGNIVPWDDNISTTVTNYAVTNCKVWVVSKDYKGGTGVRVLVYKGYPVLKVATACLNPLEPEFTQKPSKDIPEPKEEEPNSIPEPKDKPVVPATNVNTNTQTVKVEVSYPPQDERQYNEPQDEQSYDDNYDVRRRVIRRPPVVMRRPIQANFSFQWNRQQNRQPQKHYVQRDRPQRNNHASESRGRDVTQNHASESRGRSDANDRGSGNGNGNQNGNRGGRGN
jgi:hypothetical protein